MTARLHVWQNEKKVRDIVKKLIVYGSEYGTAKRYAEHLSQLVNTQAVSFDSMGSIEEYDTVIHVGALYAGGVRGLKNTLKAMRGDAKLTIITVGLADVTDKQNIENIRSGIARQVPKELLERTRIFHLRGGIDYGRLGLKHKTMMTRLYNKAKKLPEEKKTAEVRAMIDTFNTKVDFVELSALEPIAEEINRGIE